jgi:hypothetical protein
MRPGAEPSGGNRSSRIVPLLMARVKCRTAGHLKGMSGKKEDLFCKAGRIEVAASGASQVARTNQKREKE